MNATYSDKLCLLFAHNLSKFLFSAMPSQSWVFSIKFHFLWCFLILNLFPESHQLANSSVASCDTFGTCSQKCVMIRDNPSCSCVDGFQLKADNKTCIPNDPNFLLLFTGNQYIRSLNATGYNSTNLDVNQPINVIRTGSDSEFLASDVKNNVVYWTDPSYEHKGVYKTSLDDPANSHLLVDTGIYFPKNIALDWITGNIYFIDSTLNIIAVCAISITECATVIQGTKNQYQNILDIALHPNEGIMFWAEREAKAIKTAGMDGSNITAIVLNINSPQCITVDETNSRLYWVNIMYETVESTQFDGSGRQSMIAWIANAFGFASFADIIFCSHYDSNVIMAMNRFGGPVTPIYDGDKDSWRLHVMHITKQLRLRSNSCQNSPCTHICALAGNTFECLCPVKMLKNGNTCIDDDKVTKLLVAQQNILLSTRIGTIGRDVFERIRLPSQIRMIKALVYYPMNKSVIISEDTLNIIVEYKMETEEYTVLLNDDVVNVTLMEIDIIGENLIWFDAGKQTIEVMSLITRARMVLVKDAKNLDDMLFVPEHGMLYISKVDETGSYAEIFKMNLNPSLAKELIERFPIDVAPLHLVFQQEKNVIAVAFLNKTFFYRTVIRNILPPDNFDTDSYTVQHFLMDVVQTKNRIIWVHETDEVIIQTTEYSKVSTEVLKTNFNLSNNPSSFPPKKFLVAIDRNLDNFQQLRMKQKHQCSPENLHRKTCSHICLPGNSIFSGECQCPANLNLSTDGLNCIGEETQSETSTIILVLLIIIVIILVVVGITAYLVIKRSQNTQVSGIRQPHVENSFSQLFNL